MRITKKLGALRIAQALLLLFVLSCVSVAAQDGRNDSPDNQAAWRLISAQTASAFAIKDMKIVVHFTITHESGAVETGTFINEASSAYGSREELRESSYLEETFSLPGDIGAIVGPYWKPPERIVKARRMAALMAHVKVGPFYSADHFGSVRDTEIDGLAAECVSFDRDLRGFYGPGRGRADKGEVCLMMIAVSCCDTRRMGRPGSTRITVNSGENYWRTESSSKLLRITGCKEPCNSPQWGQGAKRISSRRLALPSFIWKGTRDLDPTKIEKMLEEWETQKDSVRQVLTEKRRFLCW
jgi:hypothetical protein